MCLVRFLDQRIETVDLLQEPQRGLADGITSPRTLAKVARRRT
jgi:hypothetical protein